MPVRQIIRSAALRFSYRFHLDNSLRLCNALFRPPRYLVRGQILGPFFATLLHQFFQLRPLGRYSNHAVLWTNQIVARARCNQYVAHAHTRSFLYLADTVPLTFPTPVTHTVPVAHDPPAAGLIFSASDLVFSPHAFDAVA